MLGANAVLVEPVWANGWSRRVHDEIGGRDGSAWVTADCAESGFGVRELTARFALAARTGRTPCAGGVTDPGLTKRLTLACILRMKPDYGSRLFAFANMSFN
jgi:hypothetical protein